MATTETTRRETKGADFSAFSAPEVRPASPFHPVKSQRTCAEAASACCSCCCSCFLSSWIWCSSELEASAGAPKMGEFSRRGGLSALCRETQGTEDFIQPENGKLRPQNGWETSGGPVEVQWRTSGGTMTNKPECCRWGLGELGSRFSVTSETGNR